MSTYTTLLAPGERQMAKRVGPADSKDFSEWVSRGVQLLRTSASRIR
jgi:hypothetical protein